MNGHFSPLVLVVDNDGSIDELLSHRLEEEGISTFVAGDYQTALREFQRVSPDLLIIDMKPSDVNGMEILHLALARYGGIPVIMLTEHGGVRDAIDAFRAHAFDFLLKPYEIKELLYIVRMGLIERMFKSPIRSDSSQGGCRNKLFELMGRSDSIIKLASEIERAGRGDSNCMIIGETGSGKESAAYAIHKDSRRARMPFVPFNCESISAELIETELFGRDISSPAGEIRGSKGIFEQADGGTLFLNEIQSLPLPVQRLVLSVLLEKRVRRADGDRYINVDVRVVAASSQNVKQAAASGCFRMDLLYLLCGCALFMPPLRERAEDIPRLVISMLTRINHGLNKDVRGFSDEAMQMLKGYDWPGNIRQLSATIKHAIEQADDLVETRHLDIAERQDVEVDAPPGNVRPYGQFAPNPSATGIGALGSMAHERLALLQAIRQTNGNMAEAARFLRINYETVRSKIRIYGIRELNEIS